jgi:hypothetical protein
VIGPALLELLAAADELVTNSDARDASGTLWERLERAVVAVKAADARASTGIPTALRALLECKHPPVPGGHPIRGACAFCGAHAPPPFDGTGDWLRPALLDELGRAIGVLP